MIKFLIIFIIVCSTWTSSLKHSGLCSICNKGPIFLHKNFTLYGQQVSKLYIYNDKVYINEFNSSSYIDLLKIANNNSICMMTVSEIYDQQKLDWIYKSTNFSANWIVSITWLAVGESPVCSSSNFYQLVLASNGNRNMILLIVKGLDKLYKEYSFGITTKEFKKSFKSTGLGLVINSNINRPGNWVIYNEKMPEIHNNAQKLKDLKLLFILINFITLKILISL